MNTVALVGRLLISLAAVLGLMWLIARRVKRGGVRGKNGRLIELLSRQQLSKSSSLAVVRVLDQALIVGITDGQVNVLGEADLDAVQDALQTEAPKPVRVPRPARPRPMPLRPQPHAAPDGAALAAATVPGAPRGTLNGSALSPATWRQTLESLRDLTARRT